MNGDKVRTRCDSCYYYRELSGHGDGYCRFIPEETSSSSYCAAWVPKDGFKGIKEGEKE